MLLFIVAIEVLILLLLSHRLSQILYTIFYLLFKSQSVSVAILTFVFLPGTIIHELSHLILAEVLRVPTGAISFTPQIEKGQVKLGSVQIGACDPFRRLVIGLSPIFFGLFFLSLLVWLFQHFWPHITGLTWQIGFVVLIGYLLFTVSNNMFSSQKDLEGFVILIPVLILLLAALYIAGVRITVTGEVLNLIQTILSGLAKVLGLVSGINLLLLLFNALLLRS